VNLASLRLRELLPDLSIRNQPQSVSKSRQICLVLEGKKRNAGIPYCNVFLVKGCPAMYFQMYGLPLDNNKSFILNNDRLHYLISKIN
jgi:hypothetical protein